MRPPPASASTASAPCSTWRPSSASSPTTCAWPSLPLGQTFDYDWPLASMPRAARRRAAVRRARRAWSIGAWRLRAHAAAGDLRAGWMLLILAPTSSVMPIADLAVERRMYLPLAGLMLLAAAWLLRSAAAVCRPMAAPAALTYGLLVAALVAALVRSPGHARRCGATPSPCTRTASPRPPAIRACASISA